jgi:hypothetical protein
MVVESWSRVRSGSVDDAQKCSLLIRGRGYSGQLRASGRGKVAKEKTARKGPALPSSCNNAASRYFGSGPRGLRRVNMAERLQARGKAAGVDSRAPKGKVAAGCWCVVPLEEPSLFEESPSATCQPLAGIDSLSCCGGKRGAERGGPVAKQSVKKARRLANGRNAIRPMRLGRRCVVRWNGDGYCSPNNELLLDLPAVSAGIVPGRLEAMG